MYLIFMKHISKIHINSSSLRVPPFLGRNNLLLVMRLQYVFILIILFSACKKENPSIPINYKYSYFPLKQGLQRIYKVVDITIDTAINKYDTINYELKEVLDSSFIDNGGNIAWRLERYKRTDSAQQWVISDVWENQIINNQAHSVEENIRYIKIIFPPKKDEIWNGNAFNTLEATNYSISNMDEYISINALIFDSILTVNQKYEETLIYKYQTFEQYATNVGLINKTVIAIDYAYTYPPNIPIEQRISRGHLYYQTIISHN